MIKYEDLVVQVSRSHLDLIKRLEGMGAIGVECFTHGGFRLMKGMEPAGSNGEYLFHVSVSRADGSKVKREDAMKYASLLVPAVEKWDEDIRGKFFHLWQPEPANQN